MLFLHLFALCYGSGFQTMGMFPFVGVHEQNCDRGSWSFLTGREKYRNHQNSSLSCYKRHIYIKIQLNM